MSKNFIFLEIMLDRRGIFEENPIRSRFRVPHKLVYVAEKHPVFITRLMIALGVKSGDMDG